MAKEAYRSINFSPSVLALLDTCNGIIREYMRQGFKLTVRQLYYQLVARDVVPNTMQSYKRVAGIVNDGREAGRLDWDAIEDRTREFIRRSRWGSGGEILEAVARQFHMDMWVNQDTRCFVIIEKEALVGVLEPVCNKLDVPLLAARGYPSGTVLREFALQDIVPVINKLEGSQDVVVFHLGDHDPSGIDMSRDLRDRLEMFCYRPVKLERIALGMDQIQEYNPPPNPAKTADPRFKSYMEQYGDESWELDAMPPTALSDLVERSIQGYVDKAAWETREEEEVEGVRERLHEMAEQF